jgi:hypothetical protein
MHGSLQNPGERAAIMVKLGVERMQAGDHGNARAMFTGALEADADCVQAWQNLGVISDAHEQHFAAIALCRRALAVAPDDADLWGNLGVKLWRDGQMPEAYTCLMKADALRPDTAKFLHAIGLWHYTSNNAAQAEHYLERAVKFWPDNVGVRSDHSLAVLKSGCLRRGLELHECRWDALAKTAVWELGLAHWEGEDLAGRTLLLHHEQGYGDTLCWIRFVPELKVRWPSVNIVFAAPKPLIRLLQDQDLGIDEVIDIDRPGDLVRLGRDADYHCPLLSLLRVTGQTFDAIERCTASGGPYLRAPPMSPGARRDLKTPGCKLAVGVIWSASLGGMSGRRKSVPVEEIASLIEVPGVRLFSLQHQATQELQASRCDYAITDLSASMADFADVASLMAGLDVIVTVCTGPSHLAGALGRPTLLLNPYSYCWRYCRGVETWYPTMRSFDQSKLKDWSSAIAAVKDHLRELISAQPSDQS